MSTLLIFAALIYLVGYLRVEPKTAGMLQFLLAIVGLVLWLLGCLGLAVPACFR